MRLVAIFAVLAGSLMGFGATPANAAPLCEQAWLNVQFVTSQDAGGCQPYSGAALCQWEDGGWADVVHVYVYVCAPVPFTEP